MNTSEIPQSTGSAKSEPPRGAKPQNYSMNDTLLMGNSFLHYLAQNGVKITLQRIDTGVVLTLQGEIGILKTTNGARLVPAESSMPQAQETGI